jgi:hypothetical protein
MAKHIKEYGQFINEQIVRGGPRSGPSSGFINAKPEAPTPPWPGWDNLVAKLKGLPYPYTNGIHLNPSGIPDRIYWKGKSGYDMDIQKPSSDPSVLHREEEITIFNIKDRKNQGILHAWWKKKGYETNEASVSIKFKDVDKLRNDLISFFNAYPPIKK